MISGARADLLRELSIGDPRAVDRALAGPVAPGEMAGDVAGLMRIAALIASGADTVAYQREVNAAIGAGASPDDVVDVLLAVAPLVGSVHVMTAAPRIALTLGYDVDSALETLDPIRAS